METTREERATVVTGVTGFLGRELLGSLLALPGERVVAPIRPSRGASAAIRVAKLLDGLIPDPARREEAARRVHPIETDLSADDPHFDEALRRAIDGLPARVIHGAASVAFDLPLEETRRINVEGTKRMLSSAATLAEAGLLTRFAYVSTAFVAGTREGRVYERELDVGQGFTNTYERSKLEAELLLRECGGGLPWTVLRPSIVAGRASTGETSHYHVLYWPLKVFARGLVVCIPGERDAVFDIVPVDFVVDALLHILEREDSLGGCYHLSRRHPGHARRGGAARRRDVRAAPCAALRLAPPALSAAAPAAVAGARRARAAGVAGGGCLHPVPRASASSSTTRPRRRRCEAPRSACQT